MIDLKIEGDAAVIARFQTMPDRLRKELREGMSRIVLRLVNYIQAEKLSGQVLRRKTGTLSRSIKGTVDEKPETITGQAYSRDKGNAPLAYAGFWEYGFNGSQSVKAHARKLAGGGVAMVRNYIRRVNQPARSFMRTSLTENRKMIDDELNAAVARAAKA